MKKTIQIGFALLIAALLTACAGTVKDSSTIRVGLVGESKAWTYVKEQAAKEGITIELVFFTDYPQPNAALDAGEIDLNAFQHIIYLNREIESKGYKLTPIGKTIIAPLGFYSKTISSVSQIPDNAKVVIPDDVTNGGRSLLLMQANGLIEVNAAAGFTPTLKDITSNPKNLQIIEVTATNIPALLPDVTFAVINSGVARDAGLIPTKDAFVLEAVSLESENPYINIIVARTAEKDNPIYLRIIQLYQTDKVKEIILEDFQGSQIPVWD